jgi:hypothetical protein
MGLTKKQLTILAAVGIGIAVAVWLYTRNPPTPPTPPPPSKKCVRGDPGSCGLDSDCNFPNGQCFKNASGECGCICSPGFSGPNCEIKGIPYNSPQCMGPNTQWTPGKDKNNLCVCPPGHWASGTDPKYGFVQCLKCAGSWGPLSGSTPCSTQWGTATYLANNCHGGGSSSACDEFNYVLGQTAGPGTSGSVNITGNCGTDKDLNSCRCDPNNSDTNVRALCNITGWLNPSIPNNQDCSKAGDARPCGSYTCNYD